MDIIELVKIIQDIKVNSNIILNVLISGNKIRFQAIGGERFPNLYQIDKFVSINDLLYSNNSDIILKTTIDSCINELKERIEENYE